MSRPIIFDGRGRPMQRTGFYGSGYAGASRSSSRSHLPAMVTDHSRELSSMTRTELVRSARYFKKNFGMLRGMGKSLVDHAIGPGVYFLPQAEDPTWSPEELDTWNALAWDWLQEVAKICEVSGKMTLWEVQRVRTAAKFWDGEMFTAHSRSAAGYPQLQLIRCHNCGQFGDVKESDGWTDGIKLDDVNRSQAFRFRLKGEKFATVPARSVVHSYMLEESDSVRGVTPLAHALTTAHDILDTLSLEKESVKDLARTSRVIKNESGEDEDPESSHFDDGDGESTDDAGGPSYKLDQIWGAEIMRLRKGETMESFRSDRPSPAFTGFLDYVGRDATVGTGFPYEFAWSPEKLTGPGARFVLEKVRVGCDEWRRNEVEDTLPFITFALSCGIELGELGRRTPRKWWKGEWIGGAEDVTIDKGRDANQDRENIKAALDSFKRYFARRGLWWKTELQQKAKEAAYIDELAKKYGIPAERIHMSLLNPQGAATEAPAKKSDPEDNSEDASADPAQK